MVVVAEIHCITYTRMEKQGTTVGYRISDMRKFSASSQSNHKDTF